MKIKNTKIWGLIKNKYFITISIFLLIILFIDENNLFVIRSLKKEIKGLEYTIDSLQKCITTDSIRSLNLQNNIDSIERYGREQYYMKREDEDIFIIVDNPEK